MFLIKRNIIPPVQWCHDPEICCIPLYLAERGKIPLREWQVHPTHIFSYRELTVGIALSYNGIVPPSNWMHDIDNVKDRWGHTIRSNLEQWGYEYINGQFVHKYGTIDTIEDDNIKDMLQQYFIEYQRLNPLNLIPSPEFVRWQNTFAMYLAKHNIDIPDNWHHDPALRGQCDETVALIIIKNKLEQINQQFPDIFPSSFGYDNDAQKLNELIKGISEKIYNEIPKQWMYEEDASKLQEYQTSSAIRVSQLGLIPPKEWQHDPLLKDSNNNKTVAMCLSQKGIIPPKEWMHDIDKIKDDHGNSIRSNLARKGYIYINNQFIHIDLNNMDISEYVEKYVENNEEEVCQICFGNEYKQFIKTTCNHRICPYCFMQILQSKNKDCPVCKRNDWFVIEDRYFTNQIMCVSN